MAVCGLQDLESVFKVFVCAGDTTKQPGADMAGIASIRHQLSYITHKQLDHSV